MNDGLIDQFKHNAWASRNLLAVCAELNQEQLDTSVEGTIGSIIGTLWHIISAEASYCARLTGIEPDWDRLQDTPPTVGELATRNDDLEQRWLTFLQVPFDAERIFVIPWIRDEVRDVPAGVVLAQAIHHGSEHRSQIATILTQLGIEPPEWGLWEFAEMTGRAAFHQE